MRASGTETPFGRGWQAPWRSGKAEPQRGEGARQAKSRRQHVMQMEQHFMQKEKHMRRSGQRGDRQEGSTGETGDQLGVKIQQVHMKPPIYQLLFWVPGHSSEPNSQSLCLPRGYLVRNQTPAELPIIQVAQPLHTLRLVSSEGLTQHMLQT